MDAIKDALDALIDARLREHGLLEAEPEPAPAPKATGKGKKAPPVEDPADDEVTIDTLKSKLTRVVNEKSKDEAKALLTKAKVAKLADLDPKHYEKFNKLLDDALGAEDEDNLFG